ncbi:HPF/RaiA family ribosome-associated protein [Algiphilus sp.]|uniref:HPF/RaiA family ribosome-associated protein n=1 Tax=Algiphilus sp. TaxID=1872431 RepID=UPI0025C1C92B|nr:HPF/RaiA family ribosome-associated protein [Algiphilus sp.]MCK5771059.1 HPF/RaiA family ribosome-associated protein [Algiphilus sp.]
MHVQINPAEGIEVSEALAQHIHDSLERVEKRFGDRITRVEIHLKDINGPKGGPDKHCLVEARPRGLDPAVAESTSEDAYDGVRQAAHKLEKVLDKRIGKLAQHND